MPDQAPVRRRAGRASPRELRAAGLAVGTGDVLTYCAAMTPLDPTDLLDLYWAGRATLVTRQRPDPRLRPRCSAGSSSARRDPPASRSRSRPRRRHRGRGGAGRSRRPSRAGTSARTRGRARPDGLRRGRAQAQVVRRLHPGGAGRAAPDHGADPADPAAPAHPADRGRPARPRARPAPRPCASRCACTASRPSCTGGGARLRLRPLILILDVSGSMADYSRNLLQFAYSAQARGAPGSRCSASAPG